MAILILIIILGLVVGSFLNVCIYRVPIRQSLVSPSRSYCPKCERQLTWWENIPVLSWLILKGKCKTCEEDPAISIRYPIVELLSGGAAALSYLQFGATITGFIIYCFAATLIVISFIDLDHKIIPNRISYPGVIIGIGISILSEFTSDIITPPLTRGAMDSLIGLLAGGGFFFVVGELYYRTAGREGVGGGDIKLMAFFGALLGWRAIPDTIFVSSLFGAVIGIFLMLFRGGNRQTEIPYGPWLALGALFYTFTDIRFFGNF